MGKRKQVTVRSYNNVNLVDIREFYEDKSTGELKPGKKGISLTEDVWNTLVENLDTIQLALDKLAGRDAKDATLESDEQEEKPAKRAKKNPSSTRPAPKVFTEISESASDLDEFEEIDL